MKKVRLQKTRHKKMPTLAGNALPLEVGHQEEQEERSTIKNEDLKNEYELMFIYYVFCICFD